VLAVLKCSLVFSLIVVTDEPLEELLILLPMSQWPTSWPHPPLTGASK